MDLSLYRAPVQWGRGVADLEPIAGILHDIHGAVRHTYPTCKMVRVFLVMAQQMPEHTDDADVTAVVKLAGTPQNDSHLMIRHGGSCCRHCNEVGDIVVFRGRDHHAVQGSKGHGYFLVMFFDPTAGAVPTFAPVGYGLEPGRWSSLIPAIEKLSAEKMFINSDPTLPRPSGIVLHDDSPDIPLIVESFDVAADQVTVVDPDGARTTEKLSKCVPLRGSRWYQEMFDGGGFAWEHKTKDARPGLAPETGRVRVCVCVCV